MSVEASRSSTYMHYACARAHTHTHAHTHTNRPPHTHTHRNTHRTAARLVSPGDLPVELDRVQSYCTCPAQLIHRNRGHRLDIQRQQPPFRPPFFGIISAPRFTHPLTCGHAALLPLGIHSWDQRKGGSECGTTKVRDPSHLVSTRSDKSQGRHATRGMAFATKTRHTSGQH